MGLLAKIEALEKGLIDANVSDDLKKLLADVKENAAEVKAQVAAIGAEIVTDGRDVVAVCHSKLQELLHGVPAPAADGTVETGNAPAE